ncbi:MAG TPA: GNAT family N-acetyltransferase [Phycisphaerales bacterium]|nr:GNAT family N-acetyltransferase [Phycisphaerales bacterium]
MLDAKMQSPTKGFVAITPCSHGDWTAVARLLTDVYVGESFTSAERANKFFCQEQLEPAGVVLCAKMGPGVVGVVILLHRDSPLKQVAMQEEAEFRLLAVHRSARGKGVGEALVAECIRRAAAPPLAARSLVLWTQPRMTAAQRLYERTGFRRAPERDALLPPYPHGPDGSLLERWVYCRDLRDLR